MMPDLFQAVDRKAQAVLEAAAKFIAAVIPDG